MYNNFTAYLKYYCKLNLELNIYRINVACCSPNETKDKCLEEGSILLLGSIRKSLITPAKHLSTLETIWGCLTAKTSQETSPPWYEGWTSTLQCLFYFYSIFRVNPVSWENIKKKWGKKAVLHLLWIAGLAIRHLYIYSPTNSGARGPVVFLVLFLVFLNIS